MAKASRKTPTPKSPKKKSKAIKLWLSGARLRTLPLAVAPVALGAGSAASLQVFSWQLSLLALAVALFLQIGVNYANDYSDGIRGTDDNRVGPLRLTGSKAVRAARVKQAAFICFSIAALAGLAIVLLTQMWWLIAVGLVAIVAAWYYTGGKHPYGYAGLGEVVVFIFFGPVAVIGTAFIQIGYVDDISVMTGIAAGSFAAAVLMVNNIRDIKQDAISRKRTLAVKVGQRWAKILFAIFILVPYPILFFVNLLYPAVLPAWFTLLIVLPVVLIVSTAREAKELILALKLTSYSALVFALCVGWGLYRISSPF
jgi:1,4-dihydroxy-2-naphthoate octaprenyltransferase